MRDSTRNIFQSARRFFSGTMISRITGVLRDITLAAAFGATSSVAALMVAYRLSHLFRRVLGEGALQTAFIPLFEEEKKHSEERARGFFKEVSLLLTLLLLALIAFSALLITASLFLFDLTSGNREILFLSLLLLPSLFFICLYGLNAALLQCKNHYFVASVAPAAFNIAWVVAAAMLAKKSAHEAMPYLAGAIVIACLMQWLVTVPYVRNYRGSASIRFSQAKKLLKPLMLAIFGVAASQINSALDALFARFAAEEGPAYLWYAVRVQQLPLSLFGIALSGALLPPLARAIQEGDKGRFDHFFFFAIRNCLVLLIPMSAAFFVGGSSSLNLLFGHGDFSSSDTIATTYCLWGYTLGLLPMGMTLLAASACYAKKDYKTPAKAATKSVAVNILLNSFFVLFCKMGPASVAVATSISSMVNFFLLTRALDFKMGKIFDGCLPIFLMTTVSSLLLISYEMLFISDSSFLPFLAGESPELPRDLITQLTTFFRQVAIFGLPIVFFWMRESKKMLKSV